MYHDKNNKFILIKILKRKKKYIVGPDRKVMFPPFVGLFFLFYNSMFISEEKEEIKKSK